MTTLLCIDLYHQWGKNVKSWGWCQRNGHVATQIKRLYPLYGGHVRTSALLYAGRLDSRLISVELLCQSQLYLHWTWRFGTFNFQQLCKTRFFFFPFVFSKSSLQIIIYFLNWEIMYIGPSLENESCSWVASTNVCKVLAFYAVPSLFLLNHLNKVNVSLWLKSLFRVVAERPP